MRSCGRKVNGSANWNTYTPSIPGSFESIFVPLSIRLMTPKGHIDSPVENARSGGPKALKKVHFAMAYVTRNWLYETKKQFVHKMNFDRERNVEFCHSSKISIEAYTTSTYAAVFICDAFILSWRESLLLNSLGISFSSLCRTRPEMSSESPERYDWFIDIRLILSGNVLRIHIDMDRGKCAEWNSFCLNVVRGKWGNPVELVYLTTRSHQKLSCWQEKVENIFIRALSANGMALGPHFG